MKHQHNDTAASAGSGVGSDDDKPLVSV